MLKRLTLKQLREWVYGEYDESWKTLGGVVETALARARRLNADYLVLFENVALDSSQLGAQTLLCVGPTCTYKTPARCEGKWLNDLPSQRQYAQAYVDLREEGMWRRRGC